MFILAYGHGGIQDTQSKRHIIEEYVQFHSICLIFFSKKKYR